MPEPLALAIGPHQLTGIVSPCSADEFESHPLLGIKVAKKRGFYRRFAVAERAGHQYIAARPQQPHQLVAHRLVGVGDDGLKGGAPTADNIAEGQHAFPQKACRCDLHTGEIQKNRLRLVSLRSRLL